MKLILGTTLLLIFSLLSALHIYWAAGGKRWLEAAIPETGHGKPGLEPGAFITLLVAAGLLGMGLLAFGLAVETAMGWLPIAGWTVAGIFLLRAIGEFRYVGFFKKVKGTLFAQRDTRIYSPLCIFIFTTQTALLLW